MLVIGFTFVFVLLIVYCNYLYSRHPKAIPFLLLYIFELAWILASIIYIEHGTYISEIADYSYATGATVRFLLVVLPFCICAPVFLDRRIRTKDVYMLRIGEMRAPKDALLFGASLICVYVFVNVLISGNVFTNSNITKGNFYSNYSKLPLAGEFGAAYLKLSVFILGIYAFDLKNSQSKRRLAITMFFMAVFSKVAVGEKFYGIYTLVFCFFLYKLILLTKNIKQGHHMQIKQIVIAGGIFLIAFLCVYQLGYIKSSKLEYLMAFTKSDNAFDAMLSRTLALQGHTWWGIDRVLVETKQFFGDFDQAIRELKAALLDVSVYDGTIGLGRIMYMVAPYNIANSYLSGHTRFYGGYWTVFVSFFGYAGAMLFGILVAYLFAVTYSTLYKSIKNSSYFCASICLLYSLNLYEFFRIGNLSLLFTKRAIIRFVLILIMNASFSKRRRL
ncbi:MAG: DUF6418 domain-containing protein [Oliverpabstia sp.]|nr:DUF6418 domain-containing protein [Oliverpabstia sp.]